MIEVEVKLPLQKLKEEKRQVPLHMLLEELGFFQIQKLVETDMYFDNPSSQIRGRGQALRVRQVEDLLTGRKESVITFKGEKLDQISMSRRELETTVGDGLVARELFEALDFYLVEPVVKKKRRIYESKQRKMQACLDDVEGLGLFLELEVMVEENLDQEFDLKDKALKEIEEVLGSLDYNIRDCVTNSYLSMLQGVED